MTQRIGLGEAFLDDDNEREVGQETAEEGVDIPDDVDPDAPEGS
ncbi:MAG: hypothetical protein ACKVVP_11170 [Chloroflexota bacterium]